MPEQRRFCFLAECEERIGILKGGEALGLIKPRRRNVNTKRGEPRCVELNLIN
jgi:hypothetical protein